MAPPKKKGTLKAKIAEKEASKANKGDTLEDSELEDVIDPAERKRLDQERELKADLSHAADLFGGMAVSCTVISTYSFTQELEQLILPLNLASSDINTLLNFNPRTKDDFQALSSKIIEILLKRHESKPLYASFIEHHVRALAMPLKDIEVRKAASALTTLANEKQKEQRDKTSGKKKSKATSKPTLGSSKVVKK